MSDLSLLSYLGLLNLNQVFVNEFYVAASIVGGVIMGAGFIMGGFCPGTGLSALSIGKIDAMLFFAGELQVHFFLLKPTLIYRTWPTHRTMDRSK